MWFWVFFFFFLMVILLFYVVFCGLGVIGLKWNWWLKLLGWFIFWGGSEFVAYVSHHFVSWVPLVFGLGMWTAPFLGFLCKICGFLEYFAKEREIWKKIEIVAASTLSGKRGRLVEEKREARKWFSFFARSLSFLSKARKIIRYSRSTINAYSSLSHEW